jgi:hypothetical protein
VYESRENLQCASRENKRNSLYNDLLLLSLFLHITLSPLRNPKEQHQKERLLRERHRREERRRGWVRQARRERKGLEGRKGKGWRREGEKRT